ncbi:hypothetical protein BaRGS_00002098 [Batillaria attramentaria]|uniref:ADP-ribosylation factor-like protein 16 n=1 Tax=Batillaria attramentaria TaxID=370345 RepID=A0ABD0M5A4_9CAEN
MCLLIGPTGVGKTLLLKTLQTGNYHASKGSAVEAGEDFPATIPTTGTNLMNIVVHKKKEVTVRELGGSMGPIWHSYYKDQDAFMVDVSNRCQVSAACIQLLEMLSHSQTSSTPVLILLNKKDVPSIMSNSEIEWLLRLEDTRQHATQKITVLEISAKTGLGLDRVSRWIFDNHREPAPQTQS